MSLPGGNQPLEVVMNLEPLQPRPCSLALLQSGGGKAPQQSSKSKQAEKLQIALMKSQLAASKKPIEMPEMPVPEPAAPPPPPPPAQTSSDQINAEQESRRQTGRRKGIQATMLTKPKAANPYALGGTATLLG